VTLPGGSRMEFLTTTSENIEPWDYSTTCNNTSTQYEDRA